MLYLYHAKYFLILENIKNKISKKLFYDEYDENNVEFIQINEERQSIKL
jgi:hypothetical protein